MAPSSRSRLAHRSPFPVPVTLRDHEFQPRPIRLVDDRVGAFERVLQGLFDENVLAVFQSEDGVVCVKGMRGRDDHSAQIRTRDERVQVGLVLEAVSHCEIGTDRPEPSGVVHNNGFPVIHITESVDVRSPHLPDADDSDPYPAHVHPWSNSTQMKRDGSFERAPRCSSRMLELTRGNGTFLDYPLSRVALRAAEAAEEGVARDSRQPRPLFLSVCIDSCYWLLRT